MKALTRFIWIGERFGIRFEFKWNDLWWGVYVENPIWEGGWQTQNIWVCLVPMFPIHLWVLRRSIYGKMPHGNPFRDCGV